MNLSYFKGKNVLVISGAGISVDSGLPTYYGKNGIYTELEKEFGMPICEALSGTMFKKDPKVVWTHLGRIARRTEGARPNLAHHKVREICGVAERGVVVTQNVDGFHTTTNDAENLFEIHGNASTAHCQTCKKEYLNPLDMLRLENPPKCSCGGVLKPNVVLFEEYPMFRGRESEIRQFASIADIVICVGTQVSFFYVADLINEVALGGGEIHWVDTENVNFEEHYMLHPLVCQKAIKHLEGSTVFFKAIT